jgi:hypothetical protein
VTAAGVEVLTRPRAGRDAAVRLAAGGAA